MFKTLQNHSVKFLISILRPFSGLFFGLFLLVVCLALSASLKPYALKELLNYFSGAEFEDFAHLIAVTTFYMLASLFPVVIYRLHNYIWVKLGPSLRYSTTKKSMENIIYRSYDFFQSYAPGNIANSVKELSTRLPDLIKTIFDGFICGFLTLMISVATVWVVDWKFGVGLFVWVNIYVFGSIYILKNAKEIGNQGVKLRSDILAKIVEILENIKCVKFLVREEFEQEKLGHILDKNLIIDQKKERCTVKAFALQGLTFILYQGICLLWLIDGLKKGVVTLGDFALILTINLTFVDYLRKVTLDIVDFSEMVGNIQQNLRLVAPSLQVNEAINSDRKMLLKKGDVQFDQVCFKYDGFPYLFQNKSVHIKADEKIAIVGHSGSGKSTFINLILRLYEINSGNIMIDGKDISQFDHQSLRESVSVVPQSPSLFRGTIMENIRYGRIGATDAEVLDSAKRAEIHEFIVSLPRGYETSIDSFSLKLSAGQRQRIAIARAFLRDTPLLILDEAMSHLDTITEGRIHQSLLNLMKGKTTIFVTHRPSTLLLSMDRIFVFRAGQIIENGTHPNLLAQDGLYKSLWDDVGKFVNSLEK